MRTTKHNDSLVRLPGRYQANGNCSNSHRRGRGRTTTMTISYASKRRSIMNLHLRLGERPRIHMDVARRVHYVAHLNALHPWMLYQLVNQCTRLGVRLEHLPHQRPACPRIQIIDRGREGRRGSGSYRGGLACRCVRCVELVRILCNTPW
jgi:hypothetical protein